MISAVLQPVLVPVKNCFEPIFHYWYAWLISITKHWNIHIDAPGVHEWLGTMIGQMIQPDSIDNRRYERFLMINIYIIEVQTVYKIS